MSQRDSFTGGFLAGAIFGSVVGGVLGTLFTSRLGNTIEEEEKSLLRSRTAKKLTAEESIEDARRRLEDKIAQLNLAIDDVRQRMEMHENSEN